MSQGNKESSSLMSRAGENSDYISGDLITKIASRLPANSVQRLRCVSKLWQSTLSGPYFTELFLTRSSARPRLFFALEGIHGWSFYSSPQLHNPDDKSSSLVISADFHIKFPRDTRAEFQVLTSGFIYFSNVRISETDEDTSPVICNPNTGHYAILPKQESHGGYSFLGVDPLDKQVKVLSVASSGPGDYKILTLGTGELRWRTIECAFRHAPCGEGICINGVLYYLATRFGQSFDVIVCFDIRSETFKLVDPRQYFPGFRDRRQFVNYKGKLGWIHWNRADIASGSKLILMVLEDVEKPEWSNYVYTLSDKDGFCNLNYVSIVGMTATGEIVLSNKQTYKPFYVYYFNPERSTLRRVEIKGVDEGFYYHTAYAFVDHVEDLSVHDALQLKSSPVFTLH